MNTTSVRVTGAACRAVACCWGIGLKPITLRTSEKEAYSGILRYECEELSDMSCLMISEVFNFIFMNQSSREAETF
jgi:hypothetical protein